MVFKSLAAVPFGEYFIGLIFFIPLTLTYLAFAFLKPDAKSVMKVAGDRVLLFLRPFSYDRLPIESRRIWDFGSFSGSIELEELVSAAMGRAFYTVAIGEPGESVPTLSSLKSYFSDDEWRNELLRWLDRADSIVIVPASLNSVWEMQQVVRLGYQDKLIILIPKPIYKKDPQRAEQIQEAVWEITRAVFQGTSWQYSVESLRQHRGMIPLALSVGQGGSAMAIYSRDFEYYDYSTALVILNGKVAQSWK